MDGSSPNDGRTSDRQVMALRTIVVSTRAGLSQLSGAKEQALVRARATELLADLEQSVLRDGRDSTVLAAIEEAREELLL